MGAVAVFVRGLRTSRRNITRWPRVRFDRTATGG